MKMHSVAEAKAVEALPGLIRRTLAYNEEGMLCHFTMKKGSGIPLHSHRASQIGIVISGHVRFLAEKPEAEFEGLPGDSYVFNANIVHGLQALEDTVYIEAFVPTREEYVDD